MTGIELIAPETNPYTVLLFVIPLFVIFGGAFVFSMSSNSDTSQKVAGAVMAVGVVVLAFGITRLIADHNAFYDAREAALERLEEHYDVTLQSEVQVGDTSPQDVSVTINSTGAPAVLTAVFTGERATLFETNGGSREYDPDTQR